MNTINKLYFLSFFFLLNIVGATNLQAQNGQFDVKAEADCSNLYQGEYAVKIYVKAHSAATEFNVSDQNYRFSFSNRDAIANPVADATGGFDGLVGQSFFAPHTTTGSIDTVVSYNIELAGGPGIALSSTSWTYVGKVKFDVLSECEAVDILWHDEQPINFPPTFVGEKYNNVLYQAAEGDYVFENSSDCPASSSPQPTGEYKVKAVSDCSEVAQGNYYVELYLQATDANTSFRVSDQNYRFSFSRYALGNAQPDGSNGLDGFVTAPDGSASFYAPHTTTGSLDSVVSYNIEMAGGFGYPINDTDWTYVGRVKLDVLDATIPVEIKIHDHQPINFPPTFIGEKLCGSLYAADEGAYISEDCATCTPTTIANDDFESGWGIWNDGGSDCHYYSQAYIPYGQKAVRLRDNSGGSKMTTDALDLTQYDEITVDFAFTSVGMKNGHDFWLQVSTDNGSTFTTVADWVKGVDFQNSQNVPIHKSATIAGPFTANTKIRFRCDAANNANRIHLDNIVMNGCQNPASNMATPIVPEEVTVTRATSSNDQINSVKVFPNPVQSNLTIALNLANADNAQLHIIDFTGKSMLVKSLDQNAGFQETQIDVTEFPAGFYFATLLTQTERITQKFIVVK